MTNIPPPTDDFPDDGGTPPDDEAARSSRRRRIAVIVLSIVVAILIALVIWLLVARANPAPAPTESPTASATPTASPTPTPTPTPTSTSSAGVSRCTVSVLKVTLGASNGAAGSVIVPIVFTNTGSAPCELHGYPGVSFVGDNNGTQLGAAADEDSSVAIVENTLQPGGAVQAQLKVAEAGNFSGCTVVPADGFRVYPPHSVPSVFVAATGFSACSESSIHLLTVQPVLSGG
jgi:Protein of unknown function (DUF4232)